MPPLEKYDDAGNRERVAQLAGRGVDVWGPARVYVGAEVPLENIEPGAVLLRATVTGQEIRIGRGSRIGTSGHAEVINCQIGREVELGAGYYEGATLLDGVKVRGFAEIRPGTLLEEQVDVAHSVAFKNTVLTATVVAGSLINFCDIFMSGGTSRSDHSEIGSGAIHFNFDPRGDKWSSLLGDVRGLLLRSAPVFVGGHSGLVGPVHVDFGAVTAAGSVVRRDVGPDRVYSEVAENAVLENFDRAIYFKLRPKFLTTARAIGNLRALEQWYEQVRLPFAEGCSAHLYHTAQTQLRGHVQERVKRLGDVIDKLGLSIEKASLSNDERVKACHDEHQLLIDRREQIVDLLTACPEAPPPPQEFLKAYEKHREQRRAHLEAIRETEEVAAAAATGWLHQIAEEPRSRLAEIIRL